MSKKVWSEPANLAAIAAVLLSALATAISVHSCRISDDAHSLSLRESEARRYLFLQVAEPEEEVRRRRYVCLNPVLPEWTLQKVVVTFPRNLKLPDAVLSAPFEIRSTAGADWVYAVTETLAEKVPTDRGQYPGKTVVYVPVIVQSDYIYLGEPNQATSIYEFVIDVDYRDQGVFTADFKRVLLRRHIAGRTIGLSEIDARWSAAKLTWHPDEEAL